jgi:hypothetical protein
MNSSSPDPISSSSANEDHKLLQELISSQFFSLEKSIVTTLSSSLNNFEKKVDARIHELFDLQNTYTLENEKVIHNKLDQINTTIPSEKTKLFNLAAEELANKFEQQSDLMIKELKRSMVISNEMFQVKTKYIQDDLVDLDMKLGKQISTVQIDSAKYQEKHTSALENIQTTLKMETGCMYTIQQEIREEMKKLTAQSEQRAPDSQPFVSNPQHNFPLKCQGEENSPMSTTGQQVEQEWHQPSKETERECNTPGLKPSYFPPTDNEENQASGGQHSDTFRDNA